MTLLEKLDALKKTTGDTNASLARNSGIPYTTIDGLYKKGYANMKLSTIQALCDYFNVSLDYLAKDSLSEDIANNKEFTVASELTDEERTFVETFTALTPANRRVLLALATSLLKEQVAHPESRD